MGVQTLEKEFVIRNKAGIHARPASALLMAVAASGCEVEIANPAKGTEADGNSIMAILALEGTTGDRLRVRARGENAAPLMEKLGAIFDSGFGEEC